MRMKSAVGFLGACLMFALGGCIDVTATSRADATATGGTGGPNPGTTVSVSGASSVQLGLVNGVCQVSIQFMANVSPAGTPITWSSSGGSISQSGLLTVTQPGTYTVTATTQGSPAASGQATTTVTGSCSSGGTPSISFSPHGGTYQVGASVTLTASCQYLNCSTFTWSSSNPNIGSVGSNGPSVTFACVSAGTVVITVTSQGYSDSATFTCTGQTQNLILSPAGPFTFNTGQGCTITPITVTSNMPVTWAISNTGMFPIQSMTSTQIVFTAVQNQSGSATLTATPTGGGNSVTINLTANNTACQGSGSITVQPNPLNIQLGQIGTLTAVLNGVSGTITWTSTTGCSLFSNQNGNSVNVQGARVCRDSVIASVGNVKGWTIVNVTSASNGCTITSSPTSMTVGQTGSAAADCGTANPYHWTRQPNIVSVVGAPYVCTIGGTNWPCGPTATLRAVSAGPTEYCVQPAVQDPTNPVCRGVTVTAASGRVAATLNSKVAFDYKWPNYAPPAGATPDRIVPWDQFVKEHQK